jgi:hypothetical protein
MHQSREVNLSRNIEGATFGSEFVALKTAMEANQALQYKL